jgi:hypothetical protein
MSLCHEAETIIATGDIGVNGVVVKAWRWRDELVCGGRVKLEILRRWGSRSWSCRV